MSTTSRIDLIHPQTSAHAQHRAARVVLRDPKMEDFTSAALRDLASFDVLQIVHQDSLA
jgi:hypothetical protein